MILTDAPPAPENITSKEVKQHSIQFTWSSPKYEEEHQISNYTIQFSGPQSNTFLEGNTVPVSETEGFIDGLNTGTVYKVRVVANNEFGSTASDAVHIQTAAGIFFKSIFLGLVILVLAVMSFKN